MTQTQPNPVFQATIPDPIPRLTKDIADAAATLTAQEARFVVDYYYLQQEDRKRAHNQVRALAADGEPEPHAIVLWMAEQAQRFEDEVSKALNRYSNASPLGEWARGIVGIGPVIAAGLLAHIDITKAPTVGHIWRFAGLDPTIKWEAKQKRPYNAKLKVLTWKIGESFVKTQNNPNDIYGRVYVIRKEAETRKNEAGEFADQAEQALKDKNYAHDTEAYKAYIQGKLPLARIHARAKRYAVKLFLSHYHHVAYEIEYKTPPPKPYILNFPPHSNYIGPPNWP